MTALDLQPREDDAAIPDHLIPSKRILWFLRGLCLVGLSVSGYLAWTSFNSSPVYGCSGEVFNCGHVLTSGWSKWFGIPVGAPAFGLYASLLTVLFFLRPETPIAVRVAGWKVLTGGTIAAGLSALWFIGLQIFVIQHLCIYCLAAHCCALTLSSWVLWNRPLGGPKTTQLGFAGFAGVLVLVGGQVFGPQPQTFEVEHFDTPAIAGGAEGIDSSEVVLAPGEVMEAPGEYVSAPGEVFEAPVDIEAPVEAAPASDPAVTETVPTPLTNESARNTDREDAGGSNPSTTTERTSEKAEKAVTDVTASLLLIVPGTISRMGIMTQMLMPTAESGPAADSAAIAAAAAATQVALLAEGDAAAEPASGETAVPEAKNPESSNTASGSSEASGSAATEKKEAASADAKPANDSETAKEPERKESLKPEPRLVSVSGNLFRLNVAQWPLLGTPDAKYIFVEMFDYTCPHCRNTHSTIHKALEKYGKDLAIVTLVVPLHPSCNSAASGGNADACELARLSLGVWRVKPSAFREYHDWMFSGGRNRTAQEARMQAEKLVGAEVLKAELSRKTVGEYIARHVDLYRKVGSGSVPKIMFPKSTMTGEVGSVSSLQAAIEREFAGL
jgi:protein-disulfide isomerase/uncharacterized membrane protein